MIRANRTTTLATVLSEDTYLGGGATAGLTRGGPFGSTRDIAAWGLWASRGPRMGTIDLENLRRSGCDVI